MQLLCYSGTVLPARATRNRVIVLEPACVVSWQDPVKSARDSRLRLGLEGASRPSYHLGGCVVPDFSRTGLLPVLFSWAGDFLMDFLLSFVSADILGDGAAAGRRW